MHDGEQAFVVDPQRDIDRVIALLERHRLRLTHVFESHIHNDYVTGGLALARRTGAAYLVNAEDGVSFERTPIRDGEVVEIGPRMRVTAIATPGHTFTHLSYTLTDAVSDAQEAVFSGGSLLYGATGRPDLLGPDHTDDLVHAQHASAHKLAARAARHTEVTRPTASDLLLRDPVRGIVVDDRPGEAGQSRAHQDEETYVHELLAGLDAYPAYYAHMAPANTAGPAEPDLSTPPGQNPPSCGDGSMPGNGSSTCAAARRSQPGTSRLGELRARRRIRHLPGLADEWGTPLTLLGETAEDVAEAQRELVRIGIDRPAAHATGKPEDWVAGTSRRVAAFPIATFADLAQVPPPPRRHRAGRAPQRRIRGLPDRRGAQHPDSRAARPAVRDPRRRGLGALRRRLPRIGRRLAARRLRALPGRDRRLVRQRQARRSAAGGHESVTLAIAAAAGALIGLSLGALGGGGSVLAVPVLVYVLGQSPAQATTGSLVVVGVTAMVGAVTAYRSGTALLARG